MTSIKPPGGPGGIQPPSTPDGPQRTGGAGAEAFTDRVEAHATKPGGGVGALDTPQAVIAELRAGRIAPADALKQLTDLAVARSGAPPSARPGVEARIRDLLANDPLLRDLVRQMGVADPTET